VFCGQRFKDGANVFARTAGGFLKFIIVCE
jgi:hypothetical protein